MTSLKGARWLINRRHGKITGKPNAVTGIFTDVSIDPLNRALNICSNDGKGIIVTQSKVC